MLYIFYSIIPKKSKNELCKIDEVKLSRDKIPYNNLLLNPPMV